MVFGINKDLAIGDELDTAGDVLLAIDTLGGLCEFAWIGKAEAQLLIQHLTDFFKL